MVLVDNASEVRRVFGYGMSFLVTNNAVCVNVSGHVVVEVGGVSRNGFLFTQSACLIFRFRLSSDSAFNRSHI